MATGVMLNIRVSEGTHEALAELAKLEHRSITAMARELIGEALEVRRQQGGGSRRREGIQTGIEERVESAFEKLVGGPKKDAGDRRADPWPPGSV